MKFLKGEPQHNFYDSMSLSWLENLFVGSSLRGGALNQNMFNDDFQNVVRHADVRDGTPFEVKSNNSDFAKKLLGSFQTQYDPRSVDEKIAELVGEIVQSLLLNCNAYYFVHDGNEEKSIRINPCRGNNLFNFAGLVVQYLPRRIERNWENERAELQRELRLLDSMRTLRFSWPAPVRRKIFGQNRILSYLDRFDGSVLLSFHAQATHENPYPKNDFDFTKWREVQDIAFYKATRKTGWNGRKYNSQKRSDFFDCHRLIRFRKNQLQVRDHVLMQLGHELTRVGQRFVNGFKVKISASSELPSVAHLDQLDVRLKLEEVGFSEVIEYCFKS